MRWVLLFGLLFLACEEVSQPEASGTKLVTIVSGWHPIYRYVDTEMGVVVYLSGEDSICAVPIAKSSEEKP